MIDRAESHAHVQEVVLGVLVLHGTEVVANTLAVHDTLAPALGKVVSDLSAVGEVDIVLSQLMTVSTAKTRPPSIISHSWCRQRNANQQRVAHTP